MSNVNGNFKYSTKNIEEYKKEFNYSKVKMSGFYNDLVKLKSGIEKLYDESVFYMGYGLDDAPYHGWGGENLKEMREIDKEICKRFYEIYAIILCGIGE